MSAPEQQFVVRYISARDSLLLTFHAIIMRGDDLPLAATLQPCIGPNLANFCAWLGLVFTDGVLAAIDDGEIVSEKNVLWPHRVRNHERCVRSSRP